MLPPQPSVGVMATAVALMFANSLGWHLLLGFAFSRAGVQRAYARQQRVLNRLAAAVLGAFGLRLWAQTAMDAQQI
jgi:threonine efflux protein